MKIWKNEWTSNEPNFEVFTPFLSMKVVGTNKTNRLKWDYSVGTRDRAETGQGKMLAMWEAQCKARQEVQFKAQF